MASALSALNISVTEVSSSKTPVLPLKTLSASILDVQSTVIVQLFADRIFITVTQLNKFGCLYQASTSSTPSAQSFTDDDGDSERPVESQTMKLPPPLPSTSISKLVGTEPSPAHAALYELYVSQIASIVKHCSPTDPISLVVSLALKPAKKPRPNTEGSEDDNEPDDLLMDTDERERFLGIMSLVQQCVNTIR